MAIFVWLFSPNIISSKAGKINLPVWFLVLKNLRGLQNCPVDKSWVSFEKFRKFSIIRALRLSNLDPWELRKPGLKWPTLL